MTLPSTLPSIADLARALVVVLPLLASASPARGADVPVLTVNRSPDAADCPDARDLAASVGLLEGRLSLRSAEFAGARRRIEVSFDRDRRSGYRATIRIPTTGATAREITDEDATTCGPLWDALTVALALIVDAEPVAPRPPSIAEEPRASTAAARIATARAADGDEAGHRRVGVGLGGLASAGVVGAFGAGFAGTATIEVARRLTLGAQARVLLSPTSTIGPGTVQVDLFAALVEGCYLLNAHPPVALSGCAEGGAGMLVGTASGYVASTSKDRPWIAAGGGLLGDLSLGGPFGFWLRADALAVLLRENFAINGISDPVYQPNAVGFSAGAGVRATIW